MRQLRIFSLLTVLGTVGLAAQGTTPRTADELASGLQKKYDAVRDFSADFTHTYEGGVLRQKAVERGTVLIKKPGRMRWNYTAPDKKTFVSDGQKLYAYVPADKQVVVSPVPAADQATTAVLFLAGKGSLTRDFTASFADPKALPAGVIGLKLVPKQRQAEYDWLIVGVDPKTLQIRSLLTVDQQGGTSALEFSRLKENVGLSDNEFTFKIPRGVDVIGATDAS
jgi:outer membrane lipoprotein carrier protein